MSQNAEVLSLLKKGSITQKDVLSRGIFRLAARCQDLRDRGHNVQTIMETGVSKSGRPVKYARYFLK